VYTIKTENADIVFQKAEELSKAAAEVEKTFTELNIAVCKLKKRMSAFEASTITVTLDEKKQHKQQSLYNRFRLKRNRKQN
jgi:hypothetical protein